MGLELSIEWCRKRYVRLEQNKIEKDDFRIRAPYEMEATEGLKMSRELTWTWRDAVVTGKDWPIALDHVCRPNYRHIETALPVARNS